MTADRSVYLMPAHGGVYGPPESPRAIPTSGWEKSAAISTWALSPGWGCAAHAMLARFPRSCVWHLQTMGTLSTFLRTAHLLGTWKTAESRAAKSATLHPATRCVRLQAKDSGGRWPRQDTTSSVGSSDRWRSPPWNTQTIKVDDWLTLGGTDS